MIYLIHGDQHLKSRNCLRQKIAAFQDEEREVIRLPEETNITAVKQALESGSLFGQEKAVIMENLFSNRKGEAKKIIEYLMDESKILPELILWEKKEIDQRTLRKIPASWKILLFKTPKNIFKFLDSLKPNSTVQALGWLKECLRTEEAEFVFYMLSRQIRLLILAKENSLDKMAPWQKARLLRQAQSFTLEKLRYFYEKLLQIDIKIKTGKTLLPLKSHLDLLLTSL